MKIGIYLINSDSEYPTIEFEFESKEKFDEWLVAVVKTQVIITNKGLVPWHTVELITVTQLQES